MKYKDEIDFIPGEVATKVVAKNYSGVVALIAVDKDAKIDTHMAEAIAVVQVIEGKCEFTLDDKKMVLEEGDFIVVPPAIRHSLKPVDASFKVLLTKLDNDKAVG